MLDIGWAELMVIGVVALIVIGPKDLPDMFRQLGRFMAKIRGMGRDFQRAMDEAARQSGVSDVAKDLKGATSAKAMGLDGLRSAADKFEKWDPIKNAARPTVAAKPSASLKATPVAMTPNPAGMPNSAGMPGSTLTQASGLTSAAVTGAAPEKIIGPETQALMDRQSAKAAALRDYTAKLKSIDAGTLSPVGVVPPAHKPEAEIAPAQTVKPARRPRVSAAAPDAVSAAVSQPEPRRTAKIKADEA